MNQPAGEGGGAAAWLFWLSLLLVAYTYFGYPCLVALLARLRLVPIRRHSHAPSLTVVVAAHNEEGRIADRVENLLAQQYPPGRLQVLVVSDGSTDSTADCLHQLEQRDPRVQALVFPERQGKAAALNAALERVTSELVVFADARQRFEPDALTRLAENFADPAIGSASGELMFEGETAGVAAQVGLYWRYEKWIRRSESEFGSMLGATGAIYAIRRELWTPLPPGTLLDDFLTPMRIVLAGRRAIFDGRAVAWDRPSREARQEMRRKIRTLAGNFQALAHEPRLLTPWTNPATWFQLWSHKIFRLLVPYGLMGMAAGSLAAPGWFYTLAAVAQAAFYGLALTGWRSERKGRPIGSRLAAVAWTFTALNAAAVAGLWTWLRGADSHSVWRKP